MAFWSTERIVEEITNIIPDHIDREHINKDGPVEDNQRYQPSSLELSLGNEAFISSKKNLVKLKENEVIQIEPGDFALLITKEKIAIPQYCMGFISIKSKHKLSGLINISGFHVDPGYKGKLKFSVYNAGTTPVIIRYGDPTFILFIADVEKGAKIKKGEHFNQEHIEPKEMMPLLGSGIPVHELQKRLETQETIIKIYGGVLIGVFILLLKISL